MLILISMIYRVKQDKEIVKQPGAVRERQAQSFLSNNTFLLTYRYFIRYAPQTQTRRVRV